MILIAHKDDCDLRPKTGIAHDVFTGESSELWDPCSCGGIKIRVELAEANDADTFKLVGHVVDDDEGDR